MKFDALAHTQTHEGLDHIFELKWRLDQTETFDATCSDWNDLLCMDEAIGVTKLTFLMLLPFRVLADVRKYSSYDELVATVVNESSISADADIISALGEGTTTSRIDFKCQCWMGKYARVKLGRVTWW